MSHEIPLSKRQIKRQAKLLLDELRAVANNTSAPTLSVAQEAIARIWRHSTWQGALKSCRLDDGHAITPVKAAVEKEDAAVTCFEDSAKLDELLSIPPILSLIEHATRVGADSLTIELGADSRTIQLIGNQRRLSVPDKLGEAIPHNYYEQLYGAWTKVGAGHLLRTVAGLSFVIVDWGVHEKGIRVQYRMNNPVRNIAVAALGMPKSVFQAIETAFSRSGAIILISSGVAGGKSQTAFAIRDAFPDSVLIDEFRDDTSWHRAQAAMRQGRNIIAVIHASSAHGAYSRLRQMTPEGETPISTKDIALSLFQVRLTAYCGGCAITAGSLSESEMRDAQDFSATHGISLDRQRFSSACGCIDCHGRRPDSIAVFSHVVTGPAPEQSDLEAHALTLIEQGTIDYRAARDIFR